MKLFYYLLRLLPPKISDKIDDLIFGKWHYKRTCEFCGYIWGGLHCIHDGYQNPCPSCNKRPTTVDGNCNCKFNY